MLQDVFLKHLPFIVMVSQVQGSARCDPEASFLGRFEPSVPRVQCNSLHRIGLADDPHHAKISD
jgi:hypothetical protein